MKNTKGEKRNILGARHQKNQKSKVIHKMRLLVRVDFK